MKNNGVKVERSVAVTPMGWTSAKGFNCQGISREELAWALAKVKKNAAAGKDEVTVNMMSAEVLFDVWFALFEVCWEYGVVPSVWRESLVVPIPKKQSRGACDTNTYRGISHDVYSE